jgi:hypothetical protein
VTFWVFWGASAGELVGGTEGPFSGKWWELLEKGNDAVMRS